MKRRLTDLCLMAMMGTVMVVSKEALAFLPNVELVSLLTILFTLVFRRRVIGALAVFLLLEGVLYGFGTWWVMYLYIWPLLAGITWLFRWMKRAWQWAILSGLFGLAFGTLCSLTYFPVGGVQMVIAWIISGLRTFCWRCCCTTPCAKPWTSWSAACPSGPNPPFRIRP